MENQWEFMVDKLAKTFDWLCVMVDPETKRETVLSWHSTQKEANGEVKHHYKTDAICRGFGDLRYKNNMEYKAKRLSK